MTVVAEAKGIRISDPIARVEHAERLIFVTEGELCIELYARIMDAQP